MTLKGTTGFDGYKNTLIDLEYLLLVKKYDTAKSIIEPIDNIGFITRQIDHILRLNETEEELIMRLKHMRNIENGL